MDAQLSWRVHPVTRKPLVSFGVIALLILAPMLVYFSTLSIPFAVLAAVVLFASLAKFFFPTTYKLTQNEIVISTFTQTMKKEWTLFRSFYPDKNGILLSPFVGPSRLENFRGLYLMFEGNANEVTEFVRGKINAQAPADARTGENTHRH